jgi:hypothetical protein
MTVNSSCTYRAVSTCGYIRADLVIYNKTFLNDFDIAWATRDDIGINDDLDGFDTNLTTDWNSSFQSNYEKEVYTFDIAKD